MDYMEIGIQKLLRKLFLKEYPMFLDVHVQVGSTGHPYSHLRACFEVFLITSDEDLVKDVYDEAIDYVKDIARSMDVRICGVYREIVTEEQWEEWKSDKKD
jgi:hypothetical protein